MHTASISMTLRPSCIFGKLASTNTRQAGASTLMRYNFYIHCIYEAMRTIKCHVRKRLLTSQKPHTLLTLELIL